MNRPVRESNEVATVTRWVTSARRTGATDTYVGKRRWARTTWSTSLAVKTLSGRQAGEITYARAKDVSLGGMGFLVRKRLKLNTQIEIAVEGHTQTVRAVVMHCTATLGAFIVGVAFAHVEDPGCRRAAG